MVMTWPTPPCCRRDSLTSTWRSTQASRRHYEGRAAHHVDLKIRFSDIGPELLDALKVRTHRHVQALRTIPKLHRAGRSFSTGLTQYGCVYCLQAADSEGRGYVLQHELQHVLMLRFGILLGAVELECLKAEW